MTSIRLLLGFGSEVVFQTVAYLKKSPLSLAELIGSDHRVLYVRCVFEICPLKLWFMYLLMANCRIKKIRYPLIYIYKSVLPSATLLFTNYLILNFLWLFYELAKWTPLPWKWEKFLYEVILHNYFNPRGAGCASWSQENFV